MEFLKTMLAEMNAKMDATKEENGRQAKKDGSQNKRYDGEAEEFTSVHNGGSQKNRQRRNETKIKAGQEHVKEIMETEFCSLVAKVDGWRKQMHVDREADKTVDLKTNPKEMVFETEQWEVPKDRAAVKPVGGLRKRHRGRMPAAGRRGKPKELSREDCVSARNLAAACRNVSCRTAVARLKKNFFKKIRTQENCGQRKKLTPAGRTITHNTKVARRREQNRKRYDQDVVAQEFREE
jgi:hypothetical protein